MALPAEIRCSKLARPMACAGYLYLDNLPEYEQGEPAKEGTAAGELFQAMLEQRTLEPKVDPVAQNGVRFDEDMYFYLRPIAEEILKNAQTQVLCENRIDWMTDAGIIIRGQYDAFYFRDNKLYIDDLKYGWKIVEAQNNWQLLGYAIGVCNLLKAGGHVVPDKIVMRIHQPRPHHEDGSTREWEISYGELCILKAEINDRLKDIAQGNRELKTGPNCRYCEAAATACPAFNRAFQNSVDHVLTNWKQDDLDEKEISFQLNTLGRVEEILKIKKDSLHQLGIDRVKKGKVIPGYALEQSLGDRKWKPHVSPQVIQALTGKDITEKVMLSPAKAEKIGIKKEMIASLVDRYVASTKLVQKDNGAMGDKIFGNNKPTIGV